MAVRRRVVVTGVGVVMPGIAGGMAAVPVLLAGPDRPVDDASVSDRMLAELIDETERRRLSRVSRLAVAAARLARTDAGLDGERPLGLVLGTEFGDLCSTVAFADGYLDGGPGGVSALLFPNTVMNTMAASTAIAVAARELSLTLNAPSIAGQQAVARAAATVAAGRADVVLAGGADQRDPFVEAMLGSLGVPAEARGDGAAFLVLEDRDGAAARGARIVAEILGVGSAALPARPHGVGRPAASPAVAAALRQAGIEAPAVDCVYTSASGDEDRDAWEQAVVERSLAPIRPSSIAVTPRLGTGAGTGALAVAAAAVGRGHGLVHGLARGGSTVALIVGPAEGRAP